jgi:hypothetical protein
LPGQRIRESDQPARVALTAAGVGGTPYFRGKVPDAGHRVTFEADPGTMQLHVSVEGTDSDVLDSETRDIAVPDLGSPHTSLSTPQVYRARTVREMQQLKSDAEAVPTTGREFSRADRLLIKIAAYGPGSPPPTLSARLLSRAGQTMTALMVLQPDMPGGLSQIELPLSSLAAGDYILEIDAAGAGGDAQELVGFRVTS